MSKCQELLFYCNIEQINKSVTSKPNRFLHCSELVRFQFRLVLITRSAHMRTHRKLESLLKFNFSESRHSIQSSIENRFKRRCKTDTDQLKQTGKTGNKDNSMQQHTKQTLLISVQIQMQIQNFAMFFRYLIWEIITGHIS